MSQWNSFWRLPFHLGFDPWLEDNSTKPWNDVFLNLGSNKMNKVIPLATSFIIASAVTKRLILRVIHAAIRIQKFSNHDSRCRCHLFSSPAFTVSSVRPYISVRQWTRLLGRLRHSPWRWNHCLPMPRTRIPVSASILWSSVTLHPPRMRGKCHFMKG